MPQQLMMNRPLTERSVEYNQALRGPYAKTATNSNQCALRGAKHIAMSITEHGSVSFSRLQMPFSQTKSRRTIAISCMGFFDISELIDMKTKAGSIYIESTSEPHDEEQEIDVERLNN
jgi:hypothetical protein